jgi:hypothetical protein
MYDHRRALSDAELHKRGLSRETLAWYVSQLGDRKMAR